MTTQTEVQEHITLAANNRNTAPEIPGYRKVWVDEFNGEAGSPPDPNNWESKVSWPKVWPYNNEKEGYTNWPKNAHLTGDGELAIVPTRETPQGDGPEWARWASARLECKKSWRCEVGEQVIFQAEIKLGENPNQMGIWPAFWTLGKSIREDPPDRADWPLCAEWDIMEVVNGLPINQGTIHFAYEYSPAYDEGKDANKYSRTVNFDRSRWHTFALRVNRAPDPFQEETLTWLVDHEEFFQMTGADVAQNDTQKSAWVALARKPFFPILNVAVGGQFPDGVAGPGQTTIPGENNTPTWETQDGPSCGMQVRYVAVYKSI